MFEPGHIAVQSRCHSGQVSPTSARAGDGSSLRFPSVAGRTLLGVDLNLPADLPGDRTLVVVAFQRHQQSQVDLWIVRAIKAGVPATPRGQTQPMPLAVVEVPALSASWRPVRRFIDGGMTAGIGDPDVLARTITVYTDVGALRGSLDIPNDDDVWAFVVCRDGSILAQAHGDADDISWENVAAALLTN